MLELVGTSLPAKGSSISSAEPAVLAEGEGRGVREIAIGGADIVGEDIARPDDRIGGNGGAASKRLDHHEAIGIGHAWENQHVGAGISGGKRRPVKRAGKANLGISPHQPVARRAITDHDLRSGMTASEERLEDRKSTRLNSSH